MDRAEPLPEGGFICYQQFASACEAGYCVDPEVPTIQAPEGSTEGGPICCIGGVCYPWKGKYSSTCEGVYLYCSDGYSNIDGTVECFD